MHGVIANRPDAKLAWALPLLLLFACGAAAVDEEPRPREFLPDIFDRWDAIAPPVAEVDRIIRRMRSQTTDSIWRNVAELSKLRGAGKIILARARRESSQTVRLGLARAACRLGQVAAGGRLLVEIAREGTNRKVRLMAIQALALTQKIRSQHAIMRELKELLHSLDRERREPLLRVALCRTLWELMGRSEGYVYINQLRQLTGDADPAAANEAALPPRPSRPSATPRQCAHDPPRSGQRSCNNWSSGLQERNSSASGSARHRNSATIRSLRSPELLSTFATVNRSA